MNEQNMAAKILRELMKRKFEWQQVADVLIFLVAAYFISLAAGRQNIQLEGVDQFAKQVKDRIRLINTGNGVLPN